MDVGFLTYYIVFYFYIFTYKILELRIPFCLLHVLHFQYPFINLSIIWLLPFTSSNEHDWSSICGLHSKSISHLALWEISILICIGPTPVCIYKTMNKVSLFPTHLPVFLTIYFAAVRHSACKDQSPSRFHFYFPNY